MIRCCNIYKSYKGKVIFSNFNLIIKNGTSKISGANGSGKSTLLRLIANLETLDKGHIFFAGGKNSAKKYALSTASIEIPDVFTPTESFQLQAKYNPVDELYYKDLLEKLNLKQFVNTRLSDLSTGTIKKVCLVNALCKQSNVLLLDEPLNGLDHQSAKVLCEELKSDKRDKIIVDHTDTIACDFTIKL